MITTKELEGAQEMMLSRVREIVIEKMKEKNLSVYQLAREAEISSQVVAKMLNKRTITINSLAKVMKTIGVEILLI